MLRQLQIIVKLFVAVRAGTDYAVAFMSKKRIWRGKAKTKHAYLVLPIPSLDVRFSQLKFSGRLFIPKPRIPFIVWSKQIKFELPVLVDAFITLVCSLTEFLRKPHFRRFYLNSFWVYFRFFLSTWLYFSNKIIRLTTATVSFRTHLNVQIFPVSRNDYRIAIFEIREFETPIRNYENSRIATRYHYFTTAFNLNQFLPTEA